MKKQFKKIAVLADVYEMSKGKNVSVMEKVGKPLFENRIFGLHEANKKNNEYKNKRRFVEINWLETAKLQLDAGNDDWLDYVIEEKKHELKTLKRAIKFPVKDSYKEALAEGEDLDMKNDYIEVVEDQLELLENMEFVPTKQIESTDEPVEEGETTIESLKAIIKEEGLGIRVGKDDTIEDVEARIKAVKESK